MQASQSRRHRFINKHENENCKILDKRKTELLKSRSKQEMNE